VNGYVHILKDPVTNGVSLNWLLHLRESQPAKTLTSRAENVPSVYYKADKAKTKKLVSDIQYKGNNLDVK